MPKLQFAYLLGDTSPGVVPRLLWRLAGEHLFFIGVWYGSEEPQPAPAEQ